MPEDHSVGKRRIGDPEQAQTVGKSGRKVSVRSVFKADFLFPTFRQIIGTLQDQDIEQILKRKDMTYYLYLKGGFYKLALLRF